MNKKFNRKMELPSRPRIKVNRRKSLNADIYSYIAEYLPLKDVLTLSLIEKSAAKGVDYEIIWINKFRRDFAVAICVDIFGVGYTGPPVPKISHKNLYRILHRISYGYLGKFYNFTEDIQTILKNAILYAEETNCDALSTVALQYTLQFLSPTDPENIPGPYVTITSSQPTNSALCRILPEVLSYISSIKILELINAYDPHVWKAHSSLFRVNLVLEHSYKNMDIFDWYSNQGLNYLDFQLVKNSKNPIYQMNDALLYFFHHGNYGSYYAKIMKSFSLMARGFCTMSSIGALLEAYVRCNSLAKRSKGILSDKLLMKVFGGTFTTEKKWVNEIQNYTTSEKRYNSFYYFPLQNNRIDINNIEKLLSLNLKNVTDSINVEDLRRIYIEDTILWSILNF